MAIRFLRYTGLLASLLLLTPTIGSAIGNIHAGSIEIHPFVNTSYRYDDNIYLENINEVDDNLIILSPGLNLKNRGEEENFALGINMDVYRHSKMNKEDRVHNTGMIMIGNQFPGGLSIKISDKYVQTEDPATTEQTALQKRAQNDLGLILGQNLYDRLALEIRYEGTRHDYVDLKQQNRDERRISGELLLKLLPKTSFSLGYGVAQIAYDRIENNPITGVQDNRDSDTYAYFFGMRGQLSGKVSMNLKVGYETRDYAQSTKNDFSSIVTLLKYEHNISEYTNLSISGVRKNTESFYSDTTSGNVYNYYEESKLDIKIRYHINYKIIGTASGFYGSNDYNNKSNIGGARIDYLSGYGVALIYNIRDWLNVGANYKYKQRDSNLNAEDYINNQFNLTLKASF